MENLFIHKILFPSYPDIDIATNVNRIFFNIFCWFPRNVCGYAHKTEDTQKHEGNLVVSYFVLLPFYSNTEILFLVCYVMQFLH